MAYDGIKTNARQHLLIGHPDEFVYADCFGLEFEVIRR